MIFNDPNGTYVGVTDENRLKTRAVTELLDTHENHHEGKVWSLPFFDIDPVGANDKFFYITNTGSKDIAISDVRVSCGTTTGRMYIKRVTGTPSFTAGADITPVTRNLSKSPNLSATVKSDTDTTGLTDDGTIFYLELDTVDKLFHLKTSSLMIIGPGKAIALEWVEATGTVSGIVSVVELPDASEI